jgi:hypothetical protein
MPASFFPASNKTGCFGGINQGMEENGIGVREFVFEYAVGYGRTLGLRELRLF